MMIQGTVKAPPTVSLSDGNQYDLMMGKMSDLIVSEFAGKFFTANQRGLVASAALTSASALVASATNATPNYCLWNPAGNSVAADINPMLVSASSSPGLSR